MSDLRDYADQAPIIQQLIPRVEALVGAAVASWRIASGGYTPAIRLVCTTDRGSFFVKAGSTPDTGACLRSEIAFYQRARGPFLPTFIAGEDDAEHPLMIIEDLTAHRWPPPWDARSIDLVLAGIAAFQGSPIAAASYAEVHGAVANGWAEVAKDPLPFLSLELVDSTWLAYALPELTSCEKRCPTAGGSLTHFDLRSDNMCLARDRAVFIDWNGVCRGNPRLDLGFWLPSLAAEGGPEPESILPDAPEVAAWVSGFFAARAGGPIIPHAPRVRDVQKAQLAQALPWATRALDLRPPRPHR
jgi:hypothetical protein